MALHRTRRGRINYLSLQPHRFGHERGRESFHMTFREDGSRTLSAVCEIDDAPSVLRHVVLTYNAAWRPTEALVRIDVDGAHIGSGWLDIRPKRVTLEGRNAQAGRIGCAIEPEAPIGFLGCDPITSDGWQMSGYDLTKGQGVQKHSGVLSSADHRGATGPTIWPLRIGTRFWGSERIEVAAGAFDALHFELVDTAGQLLEEHPPYHLWTTADGDYIALRAEGPERRYELVELHDGW